MLDKKFKKKWVEALRSGEYRQTRGKLYNGKDGFCCLGVAAHIGIPDDWEQDNFNWSVLGSCQNLPESFRQEIGLNMADEDTLVQMNDTQRKTFKTIANWIEENL